MIAHELEAQARRSSWCNARDDEGLRKVNPLKKIPALVLDDGSVLLDSRVVCEYLNDKGGGRFFPGMNIFSYQHRHHWKAMTLQALGDGIMDAAVAWALRESIRPEDKRSNPDHIAPLPRPPSTPAWTRWSA